MRNGLAAGPLPQGLNLPGAAIIEKACLVPPTASPFLVYAIKVNETGSSLVPDVVSGDGGHGWMQLTSSYPDPGWADPYTNVLYAIQHFILPAEDFWAGKGYQGYDLVRCIAADYNEGEGAAWRDHMAGDVDWHTTNHYADRALAHYRALVGGKLPF